MMNCSGEYFLDVDWLKKGRKDIIFDLVLKDFGFNLSVF